MKKIPIIIIVATVFLVAGFANAQFSDLGFVAEIQDLPESKRDLLQVEDIFTLITNGIGDFNYLIDFDPKTTADTEFDAYCEFDSDAEFGNGALFLVEIIGQTPDDLVTYYKEKIAPSEFLKYLIKAAYGEAPFAFLSTEGTEGTGGPYPVSLVDGAKNCLAGDVGPFTVPNDFPCGIYIVETESDPSVTFMLEIDGGQCMQTVGYKIEPEDKFEKRFVLLADQFDEGQDGAYYEVKKPKALYNLAAPFDKGVPGFRPIHWVSYEIGLAKKERKDEKIENIHLVPTKFGELFVDTKKAERLLVPSFKDPKDPVSEVPDHSPFDHYKCYDIKASKGTKFPDKFPFVVVDQFNPDGVLLEVKKPKQLCVPVAKTVTVDDETVTYGINLPNTYLICHDVKPKHDRVEDVYTNNQFGLMRLDTKKIEQLCVMAENNLED